MNEEIFWELIKEVNTEEQDMEKRNKLLINKLSRYSFSDIAIFQKIINFLADKVNRFDDFFKEKVSEVELAYVIGWTLSQGETFFKNFLEDVTIINADSLPKNHNFMLVTDYAFEKRKKFENTQPDLLKDDENRLLVLFVDQLYELEIEDMIIE